MRRRYDHRTCFFCVTGCGGPNDPKKVLPPSVKAASDTWLISIMLFAQILFYDANIFPGNGNFF